MKYVMVTILLLSIALPLAGKRADIPASITLEFQKYKIVIPNKISDIGFLQFWDKNGKNMLLSLQVYACLIDETLEKDVQDIFIKSATIKGNLLTVINEREYVYLIDLLNYDVVAVKGTRVITR